VSVVAATALAEALVAAGVERMTFSHRPGDT
jgi:hypothetical protein